MLPKLVEHLNTKGILNMSDPVDNINSTLNAISAAPSTPIAPLASGDPASSGAAALPATPPTTAKCGEFVGSGVAGVVTPEEMKEAMKEIFDPEIPINIVDLGLIYGITEVAGKVDVLMTLTSPHCPVAEQLKARVVEVLSKLPGVKAVQVDMSHTPMWTKEAISFEGKLQASMLGIM
jgi:metal-sulfur cluster biosynthetic enzyme